MLMMDANNDWVDTSSKTFCNFVHVMKLVDPLSEKFATEGLTKTTYARGTCQLDFILVDSTIAPAIKKIGTS